MKKKAVILAAIIVSSIFTGCKGDDKAVKETAKASPIAVKAEGESDNKEEKKLTDILTINVTTDKGWDTESTPAIIHITSKESDTDFYHAINPDENGGTGQSSIELETGEYRMEFVSPLNQDGSAYEIHDTSGIQTVSVPAAQKEETIINCPMTYIPAEDVTDEMLQAIISKIQIAVERGDNTIKGNVGRNLLDKLAQNVQNRPNTSAETRNEVLTAVDTAMTYVDTEPETAVNVINNNVTENDNTTQKPQAAENITAGGNAGNNQVTNNATENNNTAQNQNQDYQNQTAQPPVVETKPAPAQPVHTHTWADHAATRKEWVANIVVVPDYETKKAAMWHCSGCGADFEASKEVQEEHSLNHLLKGEDENGYMFESITTIQVGSHEEDQGHYENVSYVDYQYCTECGEKK